MEDDHRLAARIKIPITGLFKMLRTMSEVMTRYEQQFGEIREPEER